jgi:hypothetical protein
MAQPSNVQVRGQVVFADKLSSSAYSPLVNAKIELIEYYSAQSASVSDTTRTDSKGFYYLKATFPYTFTYYIRVNGSKSYQVSVEPADSKTKYCDIPRLIY